MSSGATMNRYYNNHEEEKALFTREEAKEIFEKGMDNYVYVDGNGRVFRVDEPGCKMPNALQCKETGELRAI